MHLIISNLNKHEVKWMRYRMAVAAGTWQWWEWINMWNLANLACGNWNNEIQPG